MANIAKRADVPATERGYFATAWLEGSTARARSGDSGRALSADRLYENASLNGVLSRHSRMSAGPRCKGSPAADHPSTPPMTSVASRPRSRSARAANDELKPWRQITIRCGRGFASGMQVSAVGSSRHSRTVRSITIARASSPARARCAGVRVSIRSANPSWTARHASRGAIRAHPFRASAKAASMADTAKTVLRRRGHLEEAQDASMGSSRRRILSRQPTRERADARRSDLCGTEVDGA
jgi:hypothetical protein